VVVAVCVGVNAQASVSNLRADEMDSLAKIENNKPALDSLPRSNVTRPTHDKTPQELMAEDPDAIFVGRDALSVTFPSITAKVPDDHKGRGFIKGHDSVCEYLMVASLGLEEATDLHNTRLYDLAARLECDWTACRMCQQRFNHVFQYCVHNGAKDWTVRGVCEDKNKDVETARLQEMIFANDQPNCRVWRDMQFAQVRCGPDDAAICQGAFTMAEVCHYLGLNAKGFLQMSPFSSLAPWACHKTMQCKENTLLRWDGVDPYPLDFGNEKGRLGLYNSDSL